MGLESLIPQNYFLRNCKKFFKVFFFKKKTWDKKCSKKYYQDKLALSKFGGHIQSGSGVVVSLVCHMIYKTT